MIKPIFKAATKEQINKRLKPAYDEFKFFSREDMIDILTHIKNRVIGQKFYECMEVK